MQTEETVGRKIQRALRLGQALCLVWQSGPGWTLLSLALLVVQSVLPLLALYLMKLVVDTVADGLAAPNKGTAFGPVAILLGLAGAVALVGAVCHSLAKLVSEAQGQIVTDYMHDLLHAKSTETDLEYFEHAHYYDTLHRAQQEAPLRPMYILRTLLRFGQNGFSLLVMAGLLFSFHWSTVAMLCAAVIPGALVGLKYADQMYQWQRRKTSTERRARYLSWMLTDQAHAKEIRLFALGALFICRFRDVCAQLRRERLSIATRRSVSELTSQASATLAVFGAYAFIAYRTMQGQITLGDLVMYYQAFQRGLGFLKETLNSVVELYEHNVFLTDFYAFLALERKVISPIQPKPVPRPMRSGIVFNHVSFRYPTGSKAVLTDIALTIRPGETVALVGANGSGKTTLIKLLCRLYDPTAGSITLDGIDLRQFDSATLRRHMSVIFQDYARYHLTAKENIWFGNIDVPLEQERIVTVARHADADEIIKRLPHGYDTMLGKMFENGAELSIGQWQKVALARAFLRDAQIIVLDEPTSALDVQAEYEVFKQFRHLVKGRTAILISHRFSTVKMADSIYVLKDGSIVESGTHDELMQHGGWYAHLFEIQAQYYR